MEVLPAIVLYAEVILFSLVDRNLWRTLYTPFNILAIPYSVVLALCLAQEDLNTHFKGNHIPVALVLIQDVLRPDIQNILNYFARQDVTIKIISGDDVHTVQAIAQKAGVQGTGIDMDTVEDVEKVVDSHAIFGRVTPEQKRDM